MRGVRSFIIAVGVATVIGGATAGAEPSQNVTIEVTSTARTISVAGDVSFSVPEGTSSVDETDTSSTLTFTNPIGAGGNAKITVQRGCCPNLNGLKLTVSIPSGAETAPFFEGTDTGIKTLRDDIPEAADPQEVTLTWNLSGNAPLAPMSISSDITFVIDAS